MRSFSPKFMYNTVLKCMVTGICYCVSIYCFIAFSKKYKKGICLNTVTDITHCKTVECAFYYKLRCNFVENKTKIKTYALFIISA